MSIWGAIRWVLNEIMVVKRRDGDHLIKLGLCSSSVAIEEAVDNGIQH